MVMRVGGGGEFNIKIHMLMKKNGEEFYSADNNLETKFYTLEPIL